MVKIVAQNQQFLGVNRAIEAVQRPHERGGKLGVFWHTQGAGKSYSMVFFTRKVHRKLGGNFTFLVLPIATTSTLRSTRPSPAAGWWTTRKTPAVRAEREHLSQLLGRAQGLRLLADPEVQHRMSIRTARTRTATTSSSSPTRRTARSTAGWRSICETRCRTRVYIGFTGTPLFKDDEITRRVFGDYVSTYDFQRAVEDDATVPLYYDARGEKLGRRHSPISTSGSLRS